MILTKFKVPKFLSNALLSKDLNDRSLIANLEDSQGLKLTLRDNISQQFMIPKEYTFREKPNTDEQSFAVQKKVFREAVSYSILGKGHLKYEAQPVADEMYFKLKKSQIKLKNEPERKVQQISQIRTIKPVSSFKEDLVFKAKKKEDGKRFRGEKQDVYNMLFKAFEKHQYYNIKDLVAITQQPVTYLKEIMKEICSYSTKQPYKNMWELKPEYRHYKNE